MIIAPAGPNDVLRLFALGYGLSHCEQEVIDSTIRGASIKQFSQTLYISQ